MCVPLPFPSPPPFFRDITDAPWCADVTEQPTEEDYAQGLRKQQMVMEFDMATWRVRVSLSTSLLGHSLTGLAFVRAV